jgi:gamma-polyglutamate synthase
VPMFATNDRESVISTFRLLQAHFPQDATVLGILNNRADRGRRAKLFADMVPHDLRDYLDHVITFGAYEETITPTMVAGGYPADRIHNLGETHSPRLADILDTIAGLIDGEHGVLVGMGNIHTHQAELLIEHFEELRGGVHDEELAASRAPERLPQGSQRVRRAGARWRPAAPPAGQSALLGAERSGA